MSYFSFYPIVYIYFFFVFLLEPSAACNGGGPAAAPCVGRLSRQHGGRLDGGMCVNR